MDGISSLAVLGRHGEVLVLEDEEAIDRVYRDGLVHVGRVRRQELRAWDGETQFFRSQPALSGELPWGGLQVDPCNHSIHQERRGRLRATRGGGWRNQDRRSRTNEPQCSPPHEEGDPVEAPLPHWRSSTDRHSCALRTLSERGRPWSSPGSARWSVREPSATMVRA